MIASWSKRGLEGGGSLGFVVVGPFYSVIFNSEPKSWFQTSKGLHLGAYLRGLYVSLLWLMC